MKFKVAYTKDLKKISPALSDGTIDDGDLVVVDDNSDYGKMVFIKEDKSQLIIAPPIDNDTLKFTNGKLQINNVYTKEEVDQKISEKSTSWGDF